MQRKLMVAGFGGQGIMMLGKLLSFAVSEATENHVTFFPSYGAEQRGGTANGYVVISDEEIGEPFGDDMDDMIVMNAPSLEKFLHKLKNGGTLFINSSIVKTKVAREEGKVIEVPVTEMAMEMGNPKVLNIIMLGAYIGYTGVIGEDIVLNTIVQKLGRKPELIELNKKAFVKGTAIGRSARLG